MRRLDPSLKKYFDEKLAKTPVFQLARDPRKMLMLTALSCKGVTETGDNKGPIIELFQKTIGVAASEPWCLAFIQSCVAYVESYGFKSGLAASEHCLTAWRESAAIHQISPEAGDIVIWRFGATTSGHAGLILNVTPGAIETIEGNTSGALGAKIKREGDGVYTKKRPVVGVGKMRPVGYLGVFDL